MGNETSAPVIDNGVLLPEAANIPLDNPDVDKRINLGTTAPNCQPKHTREALKQEARRASSPRKQYESLDKTEEDLIEDETSTHSEAKGETGLEIVHEENGTNRVYATHEKKTSMDSSSSSLLEEESSKRNKLKSSASRSSLSSAGDDGDRSDADTDVERKKSTNAGQAKMGYIQMAKLGYQELVNAIIRPPRADYKEESLGPPAFMFCGRRFTRTDFALKTKRGLNLQCSHWEPVERMNDRIPVVIYMHGNSSARVEVLPQLSYLLAMGVAVFSFDFAGSGKSDGEYVSLGYFEREDLMCVVAHLRATKVVSTIALWGRSMGAATALMHGDRDPSIACMILDSSFADLTQLAEEMVDKGRDQGIYVPNLVAAVVIRMIRSSVKKQANFDMRHISPIFHADKCFIPALFVAGEHDDFINKRHSEMIHAKYAGDKNMIVVEGDHNSPRPKFMFDSVSIFLQTCLQIPSVWALKVHPGMNLMAPPWFYPGHTTNYRSSSLSKSNGSSTHHDRRTQRANGPSSKGYDNESMGMTSERQKEIQASLFKMLGQPDEETS